MSKTENQEVGSDTWSGSERDFELLRTSPMKRRAFLTRMGSAGLGVAAASMLGGTLLTGCGGGGGGGIAGTGGVFSSAAFPGITGRNINEVVLNFALTLEILEADLYRQALNAATGKPLTDDLLGDPSMYPAGASVAGGGVADVPSAYAYLRDFSFVEAAHRDFLIGAIKGGGGTPVTRNPKGYAFPGGPGATLFAILSKILPLEETGVRAYLGAAPYITDLGLATTAVGIYSTEARHSAAVSLEVNVDPGPHKMAGDQQVTPSYPHDNTFEYYLPPATVLKNASAYFLS